MKASIYFNYASRSLFRGGQRTILAIFCVAVGVMALVALQLVGQLINSAFTSNVRAANGGDIAVSSQTAPFRESDLVFFDQLKSEQTITAYTPIITANGSLGATSILQSFSLKVVDPDTFPVVAQPSFKTPTAGTLTTLLTNNQVIVDQALLDQYQKKVGDTFAIRVGTGDGGSLTVPITIAGIVNDAGVFAQANDFMLLSLKDYRAAAHSPLLYTAVDVATSDQKHTEQAAKAITQRFQVASVVTADQALKNSQ
ncbi:MAG TPA: ABC transporter permease, partial [Ktedonobacteraceae bacterium]|nr:ABC transporter permease [Ktedonobacteraceae bacterium]